MGKFWKTMGKVLSTGVSGLGSAEQQRQRMMEIAEARKVKEQQEQMKFAPTPRPKIGGGGFGKFQGSASRAAQAIKAGLEASKSKRVTNPTLGGGLPLVGEPGRDTWGREAIDAFKRAASDVLRGTGDRIDPGAERITVRTAGPPSTVEWLILLVLIWLGYNALEG